MSSDADLRRMQAELDGLMLRSLSAPVYALQVEAVVKKYSGKLANEEIKRLLIKNRKWLFKADLNLKGLLETADAVQFARENSLPPVARRCFMQALKQTKLSFDKLGTTLAGRYAEAYKTIINEGYSMAQIGEIIEKHTVRGLTALPYVVATGFESVDSYRNRVRTLSNTLAQGVHQLDSMQEAERAGITRFLYSGNSVPERPFCVEHYGNTYTLDEIMLMDNGQGLDVLTYGGGYNCLHMWIAVE